FPVPDATLAHVEKLWAIIGVLGDARQTAEDRHIGMGECLRLGSRMPWGYDAVYRYDFQGALDRVEQRALVVNPQDDLWEVTQENAPRLRNGRLWNIPGKAHGFLKYDHAEVVAHIRAFLEKAD
ncbi:MAG TPA: alpha/beta hydrolase, partial [Novosphingobium sp.]|nr:alpha/beta hydrolase [Novosphingobium sp.]